MKEQLSSSVEAKGLCGETYVHWNLFLHIPNFSRHFRTIPSHVTISQGDRANNAKCTQHCKLPTLSFFPSPTYATRLQHSSSKATVVCGTPLVWRAQRHNSRQSPTTQRAGVPRWWGTVYLGCDNGVWRHRNTKTVLFGGSQEYFAQLCSEKKKNVQ